MAWDRTLAKRLYEDGATLPAIAAVVGSSTTTIGQTARSEGWQRPPKEAKPKPVPDIAREATARQKARHEAICNAYMASDRPVREIAEEFGIDAVEVYRIAKSSGVTRRRFSADPTAETRNKIVDLYLKHCVSVPNLAKRFGYTEASIRNILKAAKAYDGLRAVRQSYVGHGAKFGVTSSARQAAQRIASRS